MSFEDRPPVIQVTAPDGTVVLKVFAEDFASFKASFWVAGGYRVRLNEADRPPSDGNATKVTP